MRRCGNQAKKSEALDIASRAENKQMKPSQTIQGECNCLCVTICLGYLNLIFVSYSYKSCDLSSTGYAAPSREDAAVFQLNSAEVNLLGGDGLDGSMGLLSGSVSNLGAN